MTDMQNDAEPTTGDMEDAGSVRGRDPEAAGRSPAGPAGRHGPGDAAGARGGALRARRTVPSHRRSPTAGTPWPPRASCVAGEALSVIARGPRARGVPRRGRRGRRARRPLPAPGSPPGRRGGAAATRIACPYHGWRVRPRRHVRGDPLQRRPDPVQGLREELPVPRGQRHDPVLVPRRRRRAELRGARDPRGATTPTTASRHVYRDRVRLPRCRTWRRTTSTTRTSTSCTVAPRSTTRPRSSPPTARSPRSIEVFDEDGLHALHPLDLRAGHRLPAGARPDDRSHRHHADRPPPRAAAVALLPADRHGTGWPRTSSTASPAPTASRRTCRSGGTRCSASSPLLVKGDGPVRGVPPLVRPVLRGQLRPAGRGEPGPCRARRSPPLAGGAHRSPLRAPGRRGAGATGRRGATRSVVVPSAVSNDTVSPRAASGAPADRRSTRHLEDP